MTFNFNFSVEKLQKILSDNPNVDNWHEALTAILPDYDITTVPRVAAFLAQTIHESGGFNSLKENLNYRAQSLMKVWPRSFPDLETANRYAHNQEAIANRAYANRMGNGNEESGDGWKFCGRGLIQLTGHDNYQSFADSLQMNIDDVPEYLGTFEGAVQSACWFWETNNLNVFADEGDMVGLTKRINGGTLGLSDRLNHYQHVLQVLKG
jgi:putative chitinase